jgi:uncharacterized protein (TIGR02996 family)
MPSDLTDSPLAPEILAEVVARPDDDEPRLRYAEALAAAGHTPRAEFIRLQCEASHIREEREKVRALSDKAWELAKDHVYEWSPGLKADMVSLDRGSYSRGFIEELKVVNASFLDVCRAVFAACPLRSMLFSGHSAGKALDKLAGLVDSSRLRCLVVADAYVGDVASGRGGFEAVEELGLQRLILALAAPALAASSRFPALRRLWIVACGTDAATLQTLAAGPALARLESLQIRSEPRLGDEGASVLAASPLAGVLRELDLRNVGLTKAGGRALSRGGPWVHLERLALSGNALSTDGVVALARSARMPALRRLELEGTGVTAKAVEALAAGPLAPSLEALDLARNKKVGDDAVLVLARPEAFPRLRRVTLLETSAGETGMEAIEALKARLPQGAIDDRDARELAGKPARMEAAKGGRAARPAPPDPQDLVQVGDPNLKLTLIEMLRIKKLVPQFDKEAFWELDLGKKYDKDAKVHDRVDQRVLKHLLATPITREMAAAVDVLSWQADNKVHSDVWQHWDGTQHTFDLRSLDGIEAFPNIREIYMLYGNGVRDWRPAAKLLRLEEISLFNGEVEDIGQLASAPALKRIRLDGVAGRDTPKNRRGVESLRARGVEVEWS